MLEKLQQVEAHFREVESRLSDPSIIADVEKFTALTRVKCATLARHTLDTAIKHLGGENRA